VKLTNWAIFDGSWVVARDTHCSRCADETVDDTRICME
jgi:hypothetical protein